MKDIQLVIPMTGVGQRFRDAGYSDLKPLIETQGKSYIQHVLEMFSGIEDVLFIVSNDHPQKKRLTDKLRKLSRNAMISEIDSHKLGPSHAINESKEFIALDKKIIVSYCDYKARWNFSRMSDQLDSYDGSILTYTGFHPHMMRSTKYAYVKKNDILVTAIKEKESFTKDPLSEEASAGCYGFRTGRILLSALESQIKNNLSTNNEFYVSLAYIPIIEGNGKIATVCAEKFYQWGTPQDLEDFNYWQATLGLRGSETSKSLTVNSSSTSIILAAGRGMRLKPLLNLDKPNIPIAGKKLWEYSWELAKHSQDVILVTRKEIEIDTSGKVSVLKLELKELTEGQAMTAREGLSKIPESNGYPVHLFSSDNLIEEQHVFRTMELIEECDLIVWVANNYPPSLYDPNQYSWAETKANGVVTRAYEKQKPPTEVETRLIIGNFTFRNKEIANQLIESIRKKDLRIKGEFYLDSVINEAICQNLDVRFVDVGNFFAIGTETEYLINQYYQD